MKDRQLLELGPAVVLPSLYLLFNRDWYHFVPTLLIMVIYLGCLSMIRSNQEKRARRLARELEKAASPAPLPTTARRGTRPVLSNLTTTAQAFNKSKQSGLTESEIKLTLLWGSIHSLILVIIAVVAMGFLENSMWYSLNYDRDEEAFYKHLTDVSSTNTPQGYEKAIGEIKNRMGKVAPDKRPRMADEGLRYYLAWSDVVITNSDKRSLLDLAVKWAEADPSSGNPIRINPDTVYRVKRMYGDTEPTPIPTITPTPTVTPTATATPRPTNTPTPTLVPPTPTPLPGTLPLCDVPNKEPVKVINLTQGIAEQDSKKDRNGKFSVTMFFENPNIPVTIRPGDYVCLAGSEDGRRNWKVDDKASINVVHADASESQIENLVKESVTGFPGQVKSLNATSLFKAGGNQVSIQLWDLIGDKYSSSPIWLVIWR